MRRLRELDREIANVENRVGEQRDALLRALHATRLSARQALATPPVLGAAFVAGFLLERLSASRERHTAAAPQKAGAFGLMTGLVMALARAAIGSASVWAGPLFRRWAERERERAKSAPAAEPGLPSARRRRAAERAETLH
jgi:hypothetical protein